MYLTAARIWSKYGAANEYFRRCSGSYIWRAAVSGKRCGTFLSNRIGIEASEVGVPMVPTMAKILSRCTSFCAPSTAFFGS